MMLNTAVSILLTIAAGVSVVVQQALDANLRTAIGSAAWSGVVSYAVGLLAVAAFAIVLREPLPSGGIIAGSPWWAWSGGVFGAIFISLAILLIPQMGAATFIALFVTGQMLASLMLDHYGWLGLEQRSVDLPRLIGVCLLIAGVVLIRR
jgi:bacterial/archaeal transporter family-2 protein